MRWGFLATILFSIFVLSAKADQNEVASHSVNENDDNYIPLEALKRRPGESSTAKVESQGIYVPDESPWNQVTIAPAFGTTFYAGSWRSHIGNDLTTGLLLEVPLFRHFSLEAEGGHGSFNLRQGALNHSFSQYAIALNSKIYPFGVHRLRPFVGAGVADLYYQNMIKNGQSYNQWIGAGQFFAGTDLSLTDNVALSFRGEWVLPFFNLATAPKTASGGTAMGFEETRAMNSQFFRLMGSLKVSL